MSRSATARAASPPPTRASAESGSMATQRGFCSAMRRLMRMKCSSEDAASVRIASMRSSPLARCGREVDAHRGEIAHDVAGVFVEGDEKRALAAPAGRFDEGAGERRFSGAGAAGEQRIGAAVKRRRRASRRGARCRWRRAL